MTVKRLAILLSTATLLAVSAVAAVPTAALASSPCSAYASPAGTDSNTELKFLQAYHHGPPGSYFNPYASPQKLVDSLWAGQTGCLMNGTYNIGAQLDFNHGGLSGAPIMLRSTPGQTAKLVGGTVFVRWGSSNVIIAYLHIDSAASGQPGIEIMAANTDLIGNDITNESTAQSCVMLGSNTGWGQAIAPIVAGNVIHQCGRTADGNQEHGLYFDNSVGAVVTHNVIWGVSGYAIHMYESSQYSRITQNVIADNGYGVIFAGSDARQSNNNYVSQNIIAGSTTGPGLSSYYPSTQGKGNAAWGNCVSGHSPAIVDGLGYLEGGNVQTSPMFTDEAHHVYTLQSGSPCLKVAGTDIAATLGSQ